MRIERLISVATLKKRSFAEPFYALKCSVFYQSPEPPKNGSEQKRKVLQRVLNKKLLNKKLFNIFFICCWFENFRKIIKIEKKVKQIIIVLYILPTNLFRNENKN
jgi:hypothetical protein